MADSVTRALAAWLTVREAQRVAALLPKGSTQLVDVCRCGDRSSVHMDTIGPRARALTLARLSVATASEMGRGTGRIMTTSAHATATTGRFAASSTRAA